MFISTKQTHHIYEFIINACKSNAEKHLEKKLNLKIIKKNKFPSISYLFFMIYLILSLKIFSKKRLNIKYNNVEIGRFVIPQTYRHYITYVSKYHFYKYLIKNIFLAGVLIKTGENYIKNNKVDAVYVDHCIYLNGVLYSFFSNQNIILYSHNFPSTLYKIDFKKKKNSYFNKFERSLMINSKKKLNHYKNKQCNLLLKNIFSQPNYLPWLTKIKYKKEKFINYKKFDYVIYVHSFTDGQLVFGADDFENVLDWLEFTLNELAKTNKKVLIKAHPNFYEKSLGELCLWDKKIYLRFKNKHKKYNNFYFIDKPIHNYNILKKLRKDCVLISHHGTVVLEGAALNFKTICSSRNFYNEKFKISNNWTTKSEYIKLINSHFDKLKFPNKKDLFSLFYLVFIDDYSHSGKNFWQQIMAKEIGMKREEYIKKVVIYSGIDNYAESQKHLNKLKGHNFKKVISKLNKSIVELNYNK